MRIRAVVRATPIVCALAALAVPAVSAQQVLVEVREAGTGRAVRDARLEFVDASGGSETRLTTLEGRGVFGRVPAGVWTLRVTTLAYEERELRVEVLPDTTTFVRVELTPSPLTLDSLLVATDRLDPLLLNVGFYERSTSNRGYYYDAERMERIAGGVTLSSKLRYMKRIKALPGGEIRIARGGGLGCAPLIWLDGVMVRGFDVNDVVDPKDLIGVEIYDAAYLVPIEYRIAGGPECAIVIWTRR